MNPTIIDRSLALIVSALFLTLPGPALAADTPKIVELKVVSAPPGVKGQSDSTYKEAELENGLKVLVPQFVSEGEKIRIHVEDLSYLDRVSVKSMS